MWNIFKVKYFSNVFTVNFEHISRLVPCSIVNFKHANAGWYLKSYQTSLIKHCTKIVNKVPSQLFDRVLNTSLSCCCLWRHSDNLLQNVFKNIRSDVRSGHRRCSMTKVVLKSFSKFTEKHLCQSLFSFLIKLQVCTFKKIQETRTKMFSSEFCEIFKIPTLDDNLCDVCVSTRIGE